MQEVQDFHKEAHSFYVYAKSLAASDYKNPTGFKGWTLDNILSHLWMWNWAAEISSTKPETLQLHIKNVTPYVLAEDMRSYETQWSNHKSGPELLECWWKSCETLCAVFSKLSPKDRLKWAGPDMSARSSITARLMETWAHIQAVYDLQGVKISSSDAIKHIAYLGVNTFGWSFKNRNLNVPDTIPYIKLTSPSGLIWQWNEEQTKECIEGSAEEFCQVVTQTRNIEDTNLKVGGSIAKEWMSIAQCFAGPPQTPPEKGSRSIATNP